MSKNKVDAEAPPAEGELQGYRVLRGLNFVSHGDERRAEVDEILGLEVAPKHGTGRCDSNCNRPGDHDWLLTGGDPVLETWPRPIERFGVVPYVPPGAVSLAPEEAGALSLADDAAGAVSLAGQAPAEE